MPVDQDRERCLGERGIRSQKLCQQFAIGEAAKCPVVEERFELRVDVCDCSSRHRVVSARTVVLLRVVSGRAADCCKFF